ncbi:MAG: hypothetical protein LUQ63_05580 [Methanothrix sp.]|nr:hypothetical protein [Methanothrix sp.]
MILEVTIDPFFVGYLAIWFSGFCFSGFWLSGFWLSDETVAAPDELLPEYMPTMLETTGMAAAICSPNHRLDA